ncbi:hypothetical protein CFN16_20765 [Pseudomonas fluorescens]|uniref:Secreted protein n=1 Tax=Pseudomonas fluorescens TaxID=294 RepID=A0A345V165_PSEFL|nr:hypothetical protein CFN16_20765 [Pseudomonas fluorescens]
MKCRLSLAFQFIICAMNCAKALNTVKNKSFGYIFINICLIDNLSTILNNKSNCYWRNNTTYLQVISKPTIKRRILKIPLNI